MRPIEIFGQAVLTLQMVDMLHHRVAGTAKRNFYSNREKFGLGIDYLREFVKETATNRKQILLTRSGYRLLVKSLRDPTAWSTQRIVNDGYFENSNPQVLEELVKIHKELSRVVGRRELGKETKRRHIEVVQEFYDGKCPCCCDTLVLDEQGKKRQDANWEHWYAPSKNAGHETWLTCRVCNLKLRDDGEFRRNAQAKFDNFQECRDGGTLTLFRYA